MIIRAKDMVRAHITFSGTVQGVGFRFTVQRYAVGLGLKGWVKNLPNGSVGVLIEGPKQGIEELCRNIEDDFEGYIQNRDIQFIPVEEQFENFRITY
ncbi:MAG: acylphosphatase [Candidatus Omnitrophica bacterium]|nr:acylphosphatase [Candidatus Omnitrophota bacterium]